MRRKERRGFRRERKCVSFFARGGGWVLRKGARGGGRKLLTIWTHTCSRPPSPWPSERQRGGPVSAAPQHRPRTGLPR